MKGVFAMKVRKTVPASAIENIVHLPKAFEGKNVTITVEEAVPVKKDTSAFDKAYAFLMSHTIKSDVTIEETRDMRFLNYDIVT